MEAKDPVMGTIKSVIPLYKNGLDEAGSITICENGLVLRHGDSFARAPFNYIQTLETTRELPLGKLAVSISLLDQVGMSHSLDVAMTDQHYHQLKKLCAKQ